MVFAFFFDNRGIAGRGVLPDPRLGNPAIGGTEYAFLAVVALLQGTKVEPLLFLTAPQEVDGLAPTALRIARDLSDALDQAQRSGAKAFVFRPGVVPADQWPALERSVIPLVAWFHNLGCLHQARTEALPNLRYWVLVSGAQLDYFRHSRLSRKAVVIPNPVFVPPGVRQARQWSDAAAAKDLGYVGALTPFKGFDRLAARWGEIAAACPEALLRVFGGADLYGTCTSHPGMLTPYEQHCRQLLEASGQAHRVVFEGTCGLGRYDDFQSLAVGVVNPSGCDETFCLSAAEFSACGIPVVSARRHALPQTIKDGSTGLLASNDTEFVHHCIALLKDPERAWRLGTAGQGFVASSFGPEAVRHGWLQLADHLAQNWDPVTTPPSTPWHHEQRWLRQLWGVLLVVPGWPSWPSVKAVMKRFLQGGEGAIQPRAVGFLAGLVALSVWALIVFGKYGGNPTGLARIGDEMKLSPRLNGQELIVIQGKRGNDGQQFLALALDPLQVDGGTTVAVDNPIYRGKRLLYPLLGWLLGLGQPRLIVWSLGLINVLCIGFTAGLVAQWAQLYQRSPQWGLAVLALPGYWITLTLNTADLLATSLMLTAAVAWRKQSVQASWASLTAALLTRETSLLVWASTLFTALLEHKRNWLIALVLVPLPLFGWTTILRTRFPDVADGSLASLHFTWPLGGILTKLMHLLGLLPQPDVQFGQLETLFDGLCFVFWSSTLVILAAASLRAHADRWLRVTSGLYLIPALCASTQILSRLPDYTRVWIDLSGLVLLLGLSVRRNRTLWPWLGFAAAISIGYLCGYWSMT